MQYVNHSSEARYRPHGPHCPPPPHELQKLSRTTKMPFINVNIPPSFQDLPSSDYFSLSTSGSQLVPPDKRFQCPLCPYATHKKDHITKHVRTHTGEKPFSCSHCQYRSANKANLDRHVKLHMEMARYGCSWCSFSTSSPAELRVHLRLAHFDVTENDSSVQ
ncbi:hypothetical protein HAZT_HAZT011731 [Hyalella azteca]|uniref:C2H2-type domain-containing protein n=1 Tax=Hyalella azteca TaxID=294128 RepID=A0A6A0H512_HYAAZ|nr:hypothetical protein HAZT_HAZT011731 [Hyalella azteca]